VPTERLSTDLHVPPKVMYLQVTRSLLNPKFEGYKLKLSSQDEAITHHDLDYKPSPHIISANHTLSFQEMQSRVTHNHLAVARDAGRALYISSDYKVVLIDIGPVSSMIPSEAIFLSYRKFLTRISCSLLFMSSASCLDPCGQQKATLASIPNIVRLLFLPPQLCWLRMDMVFCISCTSLTRYRLKSLDRLSCRFRL
jgi:hypothetical protein